MSRTKTVRKREARRIARYRAGLIVVSALEAGWSPADLVKRYGQTGMDEIVDQLGEIASWLIGTGHPDGAPHHGGSRSIR